MDKEDFFVLLSFLSGMAVYRFYKKLDIQIEIDMDPTSRKDFSQEMLFDCPVCGLPTEVNSIITQMGEGNDYDTFYALDCLGTHEPAAVSEQWYEENVGRK